MATIASHVSSSIQNPIYLVSILVGKPTSSLVKSANKLSNYLVARQCISSDTYQLSNMNKLDSTTTTVSLQDT